jgi:hypothetical protein
MIARLASALLVLGTVASASAAAPDWQASLTKSAPGDFPELPPLRAIYHFGWSGLTAATGEAHFSHVGGDRLQLEATGRTISLARALWHYDVNYKALDNARNLTPIETTQEETFRSKKVSTHLTFSGAGVTRQRTDGSGAPSSKDFAFSRLYDLSAAGFYLRSQPLQDHEVYRVAVYPTTSPYLATITVLGREKINVHSGSYSAIKMDLQLSKIGKNLELEPHKKFRKATIWLSDDADRIPVRIEAQIFVGTIFAELQSVTRDQPRP